MNIAFQMLLVVQTHLYLGLILHYVLLLQMKDDFCQSASKLLNRMDDTLLQHHVHDSQSAIAWKWLWLLKHTVSSTLESKESNAFSWRICENIWPNFLTVCTYLHCRICTDKDLCLDSNISYIQTCISQSSPWANLVLVLTFCSRINLSLIHIWRCRRAI